MRKGLFVSIALLFSMMFSLSGCSIIRDARFADDIVPIDDVNLEEVMAVVQISPSYSSYEFDKGGYIAFIKYDGSYDLVKIGPMENGTPLWDDETLVFSETEADYFMSIDMKPVVHKNHKEGSMQSGKIVKKNGKYFGLYNVGFDGEGGYEYELNIADKEGSDVYAIPYHVPSELSVCGDKVVVMTEEHMIDWSTDESSNTVYELREFNPASGKGEIIAQLDSIFEGEKVSMAPYGKACLDEKFYAIPSYAQKMDGVTSTPVLDVWDIEAGERHIIPLTTEDGTNFQDGDDIPEALFADGDYIYGVEIYNGRISKINAKTGEAVHLNDAVFWHEEVLEDGSISSMPDYDFTTTYSNGYVYQFVLDYKDYDNPHIRVIDAKTGEEKKRVSIPGLGKVIAELPYTGLAVNPNIDMEKIPVKK